MHPLQYDYVVEKEPSYTVIIYVSQHDIRRAAVGLLVLIYILTLYILYNA